MTDRAFWDLTGSRPIASTNYGGWVEIECTQMCGWKPTEQVSREAVRHVKDTGHETAVKHHSSIHYHVRRLAQEGETP